MVERIGWWLTLGVALGRLAHCKTVGGLFRGRFIAVWRPLLLSLVLLSGPVAWAGSSDEFQSSRKQHESQTTSQTSDPSDPQSAIRNPQSAIGLVLGAPIERELAGGEVHAYQITLTPGQCVHIVVNQRGIDVVVTLFGPDGQQLVEVNKTNTTQGLEPVSLWVETSGDYRLEVRARQEKAASGRYEVRIKELRTATVQDQSRVAAEQAFMQAEQLRLQGTAESLPQAMEKYDEALALWQTVGDQWEVAATLNSIGFVHHLLSENRKALDSYQRALPLWQAVGDRVGEATALYGIGNAHFWLDEYQQALDDSTQALQIYQSVSDRRGEAAALNRIGTSHHAMFEYEKAFKCYQQALPLWRLVGDRTGEAGTLDNLAGFYCAIDPRRALDYYQQALSIHQELGNRRGEAELLTGMGNLYIGLGEPEKALECLTAALPLRRAVVDRLGEGYTLGVLGALYKVLGDPRKAIEYWNQQLQIYREIGRPEAGIFANIGEAYHDLGDNDTALKYLQSLLMLRDVSSYEAAALYHFAKVLRDLGNLTEARAKVEAALKILESQRTKLVNPDWRALFARVSDYYELYIDLLMRQHQNQPSAGHDVVALHASERARARSLLDLLTEARADIRQGVDPVLLERERTLQQQLNAKEQSRIQLLSGKHTKEQAAAAEKELRELLTQRDEVQAQIRATSPRYAALTQPQPLGLKEIQQQVLDDDTLLLEYALGEERSFLWAVTPTSIASFELPKRVEIEKAAKHVYQLLTAPNESVKGETDIQKMRRIARAEAEYPNAAADLSQMLLGPVAEQLGNKRLLIVSDGALQYIPFAALPVPRRQLSVVSGPLSKSDNHGQRTTDNGRPLIVDHEIVSLPSASVLAVLRKELAGRNPAAKTVAVLADPVFQNNDPRVKQGTSQADKQTGKDSAKPSDAPLLVSALDRSIRDAGLTALRRLRFTQQEADRIIALAPAKEGLKALDFAANKQTATSADLSHYRIVHFATHGLLNDQHPELSGVVLSLVDEQGRPQDGFLQLHEVYNLNLPAELVVLSACKTALGKEIKGEGLVGLTRGFMYAGAARVVASLWSVDDQPTAAFMKRFYQEMLAKGQRPAAALRAAQVAMWQKKKPPYVWAAFVLQGEWR